VAFSYRIVKSSYVYSKLILFHHAKFYCQGVAMWIPFRAASQSLSPTSGTAPQGKSGGKGLAPGPCIPAAQNLKRIVPPFFCPKPFNILISLIHTSSNWDIA
jgi:hypothetical protein